MKEKTARSDQRPAVRPAIHSSGHPRDEIHYLECKIILKPHHFTSAASFREFGKLVAKAADHVGIGFDATCVVDPRPKIREVVFFDTSDFRLYNNAFILRRRVTYEDGFPVGEPEMVLKFRHPDMNTAADVDVRPSVAGNHKIKFKAELLPLRNEIGGIRRLFSHNCLFDVDILQESDRTSMANLVRFFPALEALRKSSAESVKLVNQTIVEEVLMDLGVLDFGKGVTAMANAALWRSRGDHRHLIGEFAFQCKFDRKEDLHEKAVKRCEDFYVSFQRLAHDRINLGCTKTGVVYRLRGNPPQGHE
jgi:hypothetical protein